MTTVKNPMVQDQIELLQQHWEMAAEAINKKNVTLVAKWTIGQQVWLEAKNIALPYRLTTLNLQRHCPFCITHVISLVAYKLALPEHWKIHPVFHASLLIPYIKTTVHGSNFL